MTFIKRLIHLVPVPILIVRDNHCNDIKSVCFSFSRKKISDDALFWVELLIQHFNVQVFPVHVIQSKYLEDTDHEKINSLVELANVYSDVNVKNDVLRKLNEVDKHHHMNDLIVKKCKYFKQREVLLDIVKEIDTDLLVMGAKDRHGIERFYSRSFTDYILKNCSKSLFISKAFH